MEHSEELNNIISTLIYSINNDHKEDECERLIMYIPSNFKVKCKRCNIIRSRL